jgi:hypothetical protein
MDPKMMDRIRELEKQRSAGKSVPELDALYQKVDQQEQKAYDAYRNPMKPASAPMPAAMPASMPASAPKKMAKGGTASSRADGIAQRGKTRGTMVMCGGGMARGR